MPASIPSLSVLDLSPIVQGGDAREALDATLQLARAAERLGYRRFWLAEHHNMPGVASAATAVVIGHVAGGTRTIRVGAGGIMLPNHAPLVVAEQFGTLASLYPGRIDLGLGRAPGTDGVTARALRRTLESNPDEFPQDVLELMAYFEPAQPGQRVRAVPGAGLEVPVWILGSSLFGAQLAAALGLPYAFASHFAPDLMMQALEIYRAQFKPSEKLSKPYAMVGLNVFAADTDEEAQLLRTSVMQVFLNLRRGQPTPLPPPVPGFEETLHPAERQMLDAVLSCSVVGSKETVRAGMQRFIDRVKPDELMVVSQIFDRDARVKSLELTMEAHRGLSTETA